MRGILNVKRRELGYLPIQIKGNSSLGEKRNEDAVSLAPCSYVEKERCCASLSRAPGGTALTLSKVALLVGNLLECFFGFGFLLVEEAVEESWENAFGVW